VLKLVVLFSCTTQPKKIFNTSSQSIPYNSFFNSQILNTASGNDSVDVSLNGATIYHRFVHVSPALEDVSNSVVSCESLQSANINVTVMLSLLDKFHNFIDVPVGPFQAQASIIGPIRVNNITRDGHLFMKASR